jgi:hypothetical protein
VKESNTMSWESPHAWPPSKWCDTTAASDSPKAALHIRDGPRTKENMRNTNVRLENSLKAPQPYRRHVFF